MGEPTMSQHCKIGFWELGIGERLQFTISQDFDNLAAEGEPNYAELIGGVLAPKLGQLAKRLFERRLVLQKKVGPKTIGGSKARFLASAKARSQVNIYLFSCSYHKRQTKLQYLQTVTHHSGSAAPPSLSVAPPPP